MKCFLEFVFSDETRELVMYNYYDKSDKCHIPIDNISKMLSGDFIKNIIECEPKTICICDEKVNIYKNIRVDFEKNEFIDYLQQIKKVHVLKPCLFFGNSELIEEILNSVYTLHNLNICLKENFLNDLAENIILYNALKFINHPALDKIVVVNQRFVCKKHHLYQTKHFQERRVVKLGHVFKYFSGHSYIYILSMPRICTGMLDALMIKLKHHLEISEKYVNRTHNYIAYSYLTIIESDPGCVMIQANSRFQCSVFELHVDVDLLNIDTLYTENDKKNIESCISNTVTNQRGLCHVAQCYTTYMILLT